MKRLKMAAPVIQAPMGGGPGTPALAAAVIEAGGLGSLAAGYVAPEQVRADVRAVRARTAGPLAVNLFADELPEPEPRALARSVAALQPFLARLGLPEPKPPQRPLPSFAALAEVLFEERVPVLSFTFGLPPEGMLAHCRERGVFTIGTATTVAEGRALQAAGVDAVCAQGAEAGAHRGTFLAPFEDSMVGTVALVPQLVDALRIPVIAAGGIMDGRGIAASLALGAQAAQLGTAFLRCPEAGTSAAYRNALANARDDSTALTRAFSGKPARGISNELLRALAPIDRELPAYPLQNSLTRELRAVAGKKGDAELLSLWAGQAAALGRTLSAFELVSLLVKETESVISALQG